MLQSQRWGLCRGWVSANPGEGGSAHCGGTRGAVGVTQETGRPRAEAVGRGKPGCQCGGADEAWGPGPWEVEVEPAAVSREGCPRMPGLPRRKSPTVSQNRQQTSEKSQQFCSLRQPVPNRPPGETSDL